MSEQTIQNELYTYNVKIMDKYECLSLGSTTIGDLISSRAISNTKISKTHRLKRPDVLIIDKGKNIIVYQEQKIPSKFKTERDIERAVKQEIGAAISLDAKIYVVSDGEMFIWINPLTQKQIIDIDGKPINMQLKPKENGKALALKINEVLNSISQTNNQILKPECLDPTCLAQKINSILKRLTFASAKMSLYTFVEVFLFKYLSDIRILTDENSFEYIFQLYKDEKQTDAKVLGTYLDGARKTMKSLFVEGSDGTTIINGNVFHAEKNDKNIYISPDDTDKIFKQVIQEFKKYEIEYGKFLNISKDFKSKLFETFMKNSNEKSKMGQFFTPLKVVKEMVAMIDIKENDKICDPACGVGKFLLESIEEQIDRYFYINNSGNLIKKIEIHGYDKMMSEQDDITIILAKANTLIYFSKLFAEDASLENIQKLAEELLNKTYKLHKTLLGTLEKIEYNTYNLILANPPYYSDAVMKSEAKATGQYTLEGAGVETLFLEWIVKSLAYGGTANVVLPDGIFSNDANLKLKKYILDTCFIESIISLPPGTFFNTPKKTYILTLKKKLEKEIENSVAQKAPVFTYICKSIGETLNVYRFDDPENNDLHEAVCKYNNYRAQKNKKNMPAVFRDYFEGDPQFKAIPIADFSPNASWIIENWWSEEEKIKIGINKEIEAKNIEEFILLIDETVEQINTFKEELKCLE